MSFRFVSQPEKQARAKEREFLVTIIRLLAAAGCVATLQTNEQWSVDSVVVWHQNNLPKTGWPLAEQKNAPAGELSYAQIMANNSYEQRRKMLREKLATVDYLVAEAVDKGETSALLQLEMVLAHNAEIAAEIIYSVAQRGFAIDFHGVFLRFKFPPPCKKPATPDAPAVSVEAIDRAPTAWPLPTKSDEETK